MRRGFLRLFRGKAVRQTDTEIHGHFRIRDGHESERTHRQRDTSCNELIRTAEIRRDVDTAEDVESEEEESTDARIPPVLYRGAVPRHQGPVFLVPLVPFGTKMLDIFRGLKSLIKISHIHTDSAVFRLHYSLTVIILIAFSLIVTTRQYVGNPIDCVHSKDLPEDVLNTYCWIHSTYTITAAYRKREGDEVPFPGVANSRLYPDSERKEYRYYQWVCFMLFLQVIDRRFYYE